MAGKFLELMTKAALPIIEANGCELVDSEYKKEGGRKVLRFYIELMDGRISIDQIAEISTLLSKRFDEINTGDESFVLEVSSPGVERLISKEKDYVRFKGAEIDVSLYEPVDSMKKFTCDLIDYDTKTKEFTFGVNGNEFKINAAKVAKINLHFEF